VEIGGSGEMGALLLLADLVDLLLLAGQVRLYLVVDLGGFAPHRAVG